MEQYKGQLRYRIEVADISKEDITEVAKETGATHYGAKKMVLKELGKPILQQFDGDDWVDIPEYKCSIKINIDNVIKNNI